MNDEIAELRAEIAELKKRVETNEDYRAIANLQAAYGYYVDKGLWDKAAELFAREGTLEIAGRGVYKGRERVRAYLHRLPPYGHGTIYNHFLGREGRWGEATYENSYIREDGRWRIASLHGIINFYCEYEAGWHKGGVKLLRSVDGLEPDAPMSFEYEAYPEPVIAPFHYDEV